MKMKIIYNTNTNKITTWNAAHKTPGPNEALATVAEDKLIDGYPLSCHEYNDGHIILSQDADTQLLNEAKQEKIKEIVANNTNLPLVSWNGGVWDFSAKSDYKDVYDAVTMGIASEPVEVYDAQNTTFSLTQTELSQLLAAFFSAMRSRVDAGAALINQVMVCASIAEVEAIVDDR